MGQAVAIVDLVACLPTAGVSWMEGLTLHQINNECLFGDFTPGRYTWKLENVRAIEPFPVTGRQGLFEVEVPDWLNLNH